MALIIRNGIIIVLRRDFRKYFKCEFPTLQGSARFIIIKIIQKFSQHA